MRPIVEITALNVSLHRAGRAVAVLQDIDLTVRAGEILALLGESGSGKSTLALTLLGLLPDASRPLISGSIRIAGAEVVNAGPAELRALRAGIGVVFQDPVGSLNPTMNIGRQLGEAITDGRSPEYWLDRVGLSRPRERLRCLPHQLSGGQCQRVMIAMAMARRPVLIIADEPTTALDVFVQARILQLLRQIACEEGVAMLFVTHDLGVAGVLADRLALLHAGRLVEVGEVKDVLRAPAHPYTLSLLAARFGLGVDRQRQLPVSEFWSNNGSGGARPLVSSQPWPAIRGADQREKRERAAPWLLVMTEVCKRFVLPRRSLFAAPVTVKALERVSLRVADGEAVAIVGGSGSGKSTLLRLAAGLDQPEEGCVLYSAPDRPQMVFQDAIGSFSPWLSIGEQIAEPLRLLALSGSERRRRVAQTLARVGLEAALCDARVNRLSGGQCQRAALARAIIVPPRLLLCDEAVSAVDLHVAAALLNLIGVLRRELGMALIFVTHDLAAARFVAERIIVMEAGHIVECGPSEALIEHPTHAATRRLLDSMPDRLAL